MCKLRNDLFDDVNIVVCGKHSSHHITQWESRPSSKWYTLVNSFLSFSCLYVRLLRALSCSVLAQPARDWLRGHQSGEAKPRDHSSAESHKLDICLEIQNIDNLQSVSVLWNLLWINPRESIEDVRTLLTRKRNYNKKQTSKKLRTTLRVVGDCVYARNELHTLISVCTLFVSNNTEHNTDNNNNNMHASSAKKQHKPEDKNEVVITNCHWLYRQQRRKGSY